MAGARRRVMRSDVTPAHALLTELGSPMRRQRKGAPEAFAPYPNALAIRRACGSAPTIGSAV